MTDNTQLSTLNTNALALAGQAANHSAAQHVFADYQSRKAPNTLRRQAADIALFEQFLTDKHIPVSGLMDYPASWQGFTWGLVAAFREWMLRQGYAVTSVNVRLSTIKAYAKLALLAGAINDTDYALIRAVSGYSHKETKHIDEKRSEAGLETRKGTKKAVPVRINAQQAKTLKTGDEKTPQGRRDALLMCLLLDHGLRVGEVARLEVTDFDLEAGKMTFYRPKVSKAQTHELSSDTTKALKAWFESGDAPETGKVLRGSTIKDRELTHAGMSERAITKRVELLGRRERIEGLSAHDCRHYWASYWAEKVDAFRLQEAGGWNSLAMPRRYIEAAKIANKDMRD